MNTTPHLADTGQPAPSFQPGTGGLWRVSAYSRAGVNHAVNQDCLAFRSPDAFVVADGVGGGARGDIASDMLAKGLSALYQPDEPAVDMAISSLDKDIASKLNKLGEEAGASVVACIWRLDGSAGEYLASWVGDCQISHWKKTSAIWKLSWQSIEQSYEHCGLQPPAGVSLQSPANMVGCGMGLPVSHQRLKFDSNERFVLSSDGFWRSVSAAQLGNFMNQFSDQLPVNAAEQLCAMALQSFSEDDITVLVVEQIIKQRQFDWTTMYNRFNVVIAAGLLLALSVLLWLAWGQI